MLVQMHGAACEFGGVRIVGDQNDGLGVASVLAKFPGSLEQAPALKGEPDLASMSAVLRKAGARPLEQPQGKHYTAVLYTWGHCGDQCTEFTKLLQAVAKQHPGKWKIVTVKLARK